MLLPAGPMVVKEAVRRWSIPRALRHCGGRVPNYVFGYARPKEGTGGRVDRSSPIPTIRPARVSSKRALLRCGGQEAQSAFAECLGALCGPCKEEAKEVFLKSTPNSGREAWRSSWSLSMVSSKGERDIWRS